MFNSPIQWQTKQLSLMQIRYHLLAPAVGLFWEAAHPLPEAMHNILLDAWMTYLRDRDAAPLSQALEGAWNVESETQTLVSEFSQVADDLADGRFDSAAFLASRMAIHCAERLGRQTEELDRQRKIFDSVK